MRLRRRHWTSLKLVTTEVTGRRLEPVKLWPGDVYLITNTVGQGVVRLKLGRDQLEVELLMPMVDLSPELIEWAKKQEAKPGAA
jgi:hypothetical protein